MIHKFTPLLIFVALTVLALGCNKPMGLHGVTPSVGVLSGGEPITLKVSGFNPDMGVTVYFGTAKASDIVVSGSDEIKVTTPSSTEEKLVDVRISTDQGQEFVLRNKFRYIEKGTLDIRDLGSRKSMRE